MQEMNKKEFHVAVDGEDTNPGTREKPFATLHRARDAVRELKQDSGLTTAVTVMVRGGKYFLDSPLVLAEQDSGSREFPVIYTSHAGEEVVISGGVKLTGWEKHQDSIFKAKLPPGSWSVSKSRQLTYNGELQVRARWPNFDANTNPVIGAYLNIEDAAEPGSDTSFRFAQGALPRGWKKPQLAEALVTVAGGWSTNVVPVESVDRENSIIRLQRRTWHSENDNFVRYRHMPFRNRGEGDAPFVMENILEELDTPGEWCLDTEDRVVYFWPPTPLSPESDVVLPRLDNLIDIQGASYVSLSGFTFTETTSGDNYHRSGLDGYGAMFPVKGWDYCGEAIHLKDASYCVIEDCRFYALGGNAVYLEGDNLKNQIGHNEFNYIGANGVALLGTAEAHPISNKVVNNHFDRTGCILHYTAAVFAGLSNGNWIAHNEIHDVPHHGVNLATNGHGRNLLEYNDIRRTCLVLHDTGAVNMWMDPYEIGDDGRVYVLNRTDRAGHILRYNYITDTVQGFYLDDWASNCLVYGNIFAHVWNGVTIHGGKNNLIENNIFYDSACMVYIANDLTHRPEESAKEMWGFCVGNRARNNVYHSGKGNLWWLYTDDKEFGLLDDKRIAESEGNVYYMTHENYQIGETWMERPMVVYTFDEWQKMGYDTTSEIADPMLIDPEDENFNLHPDSPALKLGFQPIDASRIGIQSKAKSDR